MLLIIVLASVIYITIYYFGVVCGIIIGVLFSKYYYDKSEYTGCREWKTFKQLKIWKKLHEYFQLKIIYDDKVAVDGLKRGIYAMHPHGAASISSWIAIGGQSEYNRTFSIKITITGANINFAIPIWRTVTIWLGVVRADQDIIEKKLDEEGHVLIMPGGIREELCAGRGSLLDIHTKHKGFLRIAIKKNCGVIPMYAKGEHELFGVLGILWTVRNFFIDIITYPFPTIIYSGPFRGPLTIIIGSPIFPADYNNNLDDFHKAFYIEYSKLVLKYDKNDDDIKNNNISSTTAEKKYSDKYGPELAGWMSKIKYKK